MEEQSFLLACYKGIFAKIVYEESDKKWIGRVLDADDLLVFTGKTIEDTLQTFHNGIEEYIAAAGAIPSRSHTQTYNMIRYGVEARPFMETAREFLREEGELK